MMPMLLLTELARLQVRLSVASDRLHIHAPFGVLTDELRHAMSKHKAALMRYASLPYVIADDVGILTGNRQEQDITFVAPEQQEAWRYKIGVMSLRDGVERLYWPRMVLQVRRVDMADGEWTFLEDAPRTSPLRAPGNVIDNHYRRHSPSAAMLQAKHVFMLLCESLGGWEWSSGELLKWRRYP